ncbi:MAG: universal stress protein [Desulfonatronovibrio sp. MSAO_Bac4]|nr:MAG: universal stress protein [Desulfonatronovibrio sp. MSAO_Bac4]
MLQKVAVKVSLKETPAMIINMIKFLGNFGTKEIHLLHAASKITSQQKTVIEKKLEKISSEAISLGYSVQIHIRRGHVPTSIIEMAEEKMVDYVALHWMPKSVFGSALFGNIDSDILRLSNLPVFIHHPGLFKTEVTLEQVLYATDFKYTDGVVLPYLVDSKFKANRLYILHVGARAPDPVTEQSRRKRVLQSLNRLAKECAHAYDIVEAIETRGSASKQIVKQAAALDVDLIVVGKSEKPNAMSQVVGSTAEILPHRTRCNIFIIPGLCSLSDYNSKGEDYNEFKK